jgi:intracellular multiplication protein IcmE
MPSSGGASTSSSDQSDMDALTPTANTPEARMRALQKQQEAAVAKARLETQKAEIYSLLSSEASKLLSGWAKVSSQTYAVAPKQTAGGVGGAAAAVGKAIAGKADIGGSSAAAAGQKVIKAGTVMFAVLTIGINTDEQSPIMAKIISGPLKGSKLMGSFSREKTKVMLKFTKLNMPDQKNTIGVDFVAIDPNTARTVVAGHVNHHYLLKYGSIFASGFLGSLGQALSNANSFCFGPNFCFQQTSGFSPSEQVLIGLGGVGTKIGNEIGTKENTTPTVTVPAGTSIGLLMMSDFTMPKSNLPKPVEAPSKFNHQAAYAK